MERSEILDMMGTLQLAGMRTSTGEIVTTGVKRRQGVEKVIGALPKAETAAKQAPLDQVRRRRGIGSQAAEDAGGGEPQAHEAAGRAGDGQRDAQRDARKNV